MFDFKGLNLLALFLVLASSGSSFANTQKPSSSADIAKDQEVCSIESYAKKLDLSKSDLIRDRITRMTDVEFETFLAKLKFKAKDDGGIIIKNFKKATPISWRACTDLDLGADKPVIGNIYCQACAMTIDEPAKLTLKNEFSITVTPTTDTSTVLALKHSNNVSNFECFKSCESQFIGGADSNVWSNQIAPDKKEAVSHILANDRVVSWMSCKDMESYFGKEVVVDNVQSKSPFRAKPKTFVR